MATVSNEEVDYESDPEEAKRSLAMRRCEASDDEEGEGEGRDKYRVGQRIGPKSDESDDQGGAAEYEDDEKLRVEDDEKLGVEDEVDEENIGEREDEEEGVYEENGHVSEATDGGRSLEEPLEAHGEKNTLEEEKKENEPFAVPTAGAFYMHDDRFRDNAGGGHRQTHGGCKLWESKDMKWGHDKFEEMTFQERHSEEGRRSSNSYRGRGRNRHIDCGYSRGNRSNVYNVGDQSQVLKCVRGKGSRKYEPTMKNNNQIPLSKTKQSYRPFGKPPYINSGKAPTPISNTESNTFPAGQNVLASSLNSASPPFYPLGSSNNDIALSQKRDFQVGSKNTNFRPPIEDMSVSMPQTNTAVRGKSVTDSLSLDKLYIEDSVNSASGKAIKNLQIPPFGLPVVNTSSHPHVRPQGRVVVPGQINYQPAPLDAQVMKASSDQVHSVQRSGKIRCQSTVQTPAQQLRQNAGSGSQASSPPKMALSTNSHESGEVDSSSESSKAKIALIEKGKDFSQGSGRSSIMNGGAQVIGATGSMVVSHGDQNFPGTPAFFPVMQFGGQCPGGAQVPAVGMAYPGYVTQPKLGLENSETTWLPVLANAAGSLGATYCSSYIAMDDAYQTRPSGQIASGSVSSRENNANRPNNAQIREIVNDELGQRQNKPRRYSEMNFGQ